jgi:recombinational DNA repair protein RecR
MAKRLKVQSPAVTPEEVAENPIVLGEYSAAVEPAGQDLYKCIECGKVNESKQCKRCGGSISRKL